MKRVTIGVMILMGVLAAVSLSAALAADEGAPSDDGDSKPCDEEKACDEEEGKSDDPAVDRDEEDDEGDDADVDQDVDQDVDDDHSDAKADGRGDEDGEEEDKESAERKEKPVEEKQDSDRDKPAQIDVDADTATHVEIEPLKVEFGSLSTLRLHPNGNLLAADKEAEQIKVICSCGRQVAAMRPGFGPEAIDVADDGTIYCGGQGKLAILGEFGEVIKTVDIPENVASSVSPRRRGKGRGQMVSGIAVTEHDVFVAFGSGWSMGSKSKLFRFDRQLENPQLLAEGLKGCCQRCDAVAREGVLYLAENAAHRVVAYDREGEVLGKWGERSRTGIEGFGSCCNPMNLCFDGEGVLYTAESGTARVKRYSVDGEYLGLVGYVGTDRFSRAGGVASSCSNIAIAVTPDGSRVYVMDFRNKLIRVLQQKD